MALAGAGGRARQLAMAYVRARGYDQGCLAICGWEGTDDAIAGRRRRAVAILRRHGGFAIGRGAGRAWARGRFAAPYLRDDLLAHGALVETLETAAPWSALPGLYAAVAGALRETLTARGTPPLVMCHISHLYETGASLYLTVIARRDDADPASQWRAAKRAACDAIVGAGGTITHHHAVGCDHAPWLPAEIGDLGVDVLRGVKAVLDPAGVLNPGKLLPVERAALDVRTA